MEQVRHLRQQKGWTQAELAFHAGMGPTAVNQIETGRREPSASSLRKLAEALDVDIPDLFRESDSSKAQSPLPFEDEQRRTYPYTWMGDALARLIDSWEQSIEEVAVEGRRAHAIAIAAIDTLGAVLLVSEPGSTLRDRGRPEYEVDERSRVADRLYKLSGRAIDRYRDSDVFEHDEAQRVAERRAGMRLAS